MRSFLELKDGVYSPTRRFVFTNITKEVFESKWDGRPITVNPNQAIELPHYLAVKMTLELVDKIMLGEANADTEIGRDGGKNPLYRSPKGSSFGVPAMRKPYEDRILTEMTIDPKSSEAQLLGIKFREELTRDLSAQPAQTMTSVATGLPELKEFADLAKSGTPIMAN